MISMVVVSILFSCGSDESFYDPRAHAAKENPLKLTTTDNFMWGNLQKVGLTVKVADQYNGNYTYGVQVFDKNPITNKDATSPRQLLRMYRRLRTLLQQATTSLTAVLRAYRAAMSTCMLRVM